MNFIITRITPEGVWAKEENNLQHPTFKEANENWDKYSAAFNLWHRKNYTFYKVSEESTHAVSYPDYGITDFGARIPIGMVKHYRIFTVGEQISGTLNSNQEIEIV